MIEQLANMPPHFFLLMVAVVLAIWAARQEVLAGRPGGRVVDHYIRAYWGMRISTWCLFAGAFQTWWQLIHLTGLTLFAGLSMPKARLCFMAGLALLLWLFERRLHIRLWRQLDDAIVPRRI